ncbi:hypothetical protein M0638_16650 [Roseomonas sp. NAR14]|uniref:Uncharacterized protein n=1 Tax=Roseomonas acroporae TaxID=2937791 RepID=A0A9X1YAT5_9PROT|nr:hypothetical protein [Roseomonas acroporae]MCK8786008.1 hypothetical protein [Roseomonas acroporae]
MTPMAAATTPAAALPLRVPTSPASDRPGPDAAERHDTPASVAPRRAAPRRAGGWLTLLVLAFSLGMYWMWRN